MPRKQLEMIYNGGLSKRFHTVDTHFTQDIAAHSFGVAWLCEVLTEKQATKNLIMAALAHDLAEYQVGDVPSPTKRALELSSTLGDYEDSFLKKAEILYAQHLSDNDKRVLKMADNMDGMNFCIREASFGNQQISVVYWKFHGYTLPLINNDRENRVFNLICEQWEKYSER